VISAGDVLRVQKPWQNHQRGKPAVMAKGPGFPLLKKQTGTKKMGIKKGQGQRGKWEGGFARLRLGGDLQTGTQTG